MCCHLFSQKVIFLLNATAAGTRKSLAARRYILMALPQVSTVGTDVTGFCSEVTGPLRKGWMLVRKAERLVPIVG